MLMRCRKETRMRLGVVIGVSWLMFVSWVKNHPGTVLRRGWH
jgi:hypothetical protein